MQILVVSRPLEVGRSRRTRSKVNMSDLTSCEFVCLAHQRLPFSRFCGKALNSRNGSLKSTMCDSTPYWLRIPSVYIVVFMYCGRAFISLEQPLSFIFAPFSLPVSALCVLTCKHSCCYLLVERSSFSLDV